MIKKFIEKSLRNLPKIWSYEFKGKISIPKKNQAQNIIEKTIEKFNWDKSVEKYKDSELSAEEISNFDLYYDDFYLKCSNNVEMSSIKFEKNLRKYIHNILESKLGKDYKKIEEFITKRKVKLNDIEILFILKKIAEINKIDEFKSQYHDLYLWVISLINDFSYLDEEFMYDFIEISVVWNIEDHSIFERFLDQLQNFIKIYEEKIDNMYNFMRLFQIFRIMIRKQFNSAKSQEKILKIKKVIFNNLNVFELDEILTLFLDLHENGILMNHNDLDKLDEYFSESKEKISIQQTLDIVYLLVKNKYLKGLFFIKLHEFFLNLDENKFNETIKPSSLSKFIWSLSQIESQILKENIWEKTENIILNQLENNNCDVNSLVITLQALNYSHKGTKRFWLYFDSKKIKLHKLGFNEIFIIAINQQKFVFYDVNFLYYFKQFFNDMSQLEFLREITHEQFLTVFQVILMSSHKFLSEKNYNKNDFYNFINLIGEQIFEKFSQRAQNSNNERIKIEDQIKLYKICKLFLIISRLSEIPISEDFILFARKIEKKICKKLTNLSIEQISKLVILSNYLDKIESVGDEEFKILDEKFLEMLISINDPQNLFLIPIFWKYNYLNEKIWCTIQIKFIENFDFLPKEGIIIPIMVFHQLEEMSILQKNINFWKMITNYFTWFQRDNTELQEFLGDHFGKNINLTENDEGKKHLYEIEDFNLNNFLEKSEQAYNLQIKEILNHSKIDMDATEAFHDLMI